MTRTQWHHLYHSARLIHRQAAVSKVTATKLAYQAVKPGYSLDMQAYYALCVAFIPLLPLPSLDDRVMALKRRKQWAAELMNGTADWAVLQTFSDEA